MVGLSTQPWLHCQASVTLIKWAFAAVLRMKEDLSFERARIIFGYILNKSILESESKNTFKFHLADFQF